MGTPDVNGYGTASLNASLDLRRQGATLDLSLAAYGALYRNQTAFNTGIVEMKVGPTFTLQRFEMDNATLGFYGVASAAILGGSLYQGVARPRLEAPRRAQRPLARDPLDRGPRRALPR